MTNALNQSLITVLEGGYDVSGITDALSSIVDSAESAKDAINSVKDASKTTTSTNNTSSTTSASDSASATSNVGVGTGVSNLTESQESAINKVVSSIFGKDKADNETTDKNNKNEVYKIIDNTNGKVAATYTSETDAKNALREYNSNNRSI